MARTVVPPVQTAHPRHLLGDWHGVERQEELPQRPLLLVTPDAGEQLRNRDYRDVEIRSQALRIPHRLFPAPEVLDQDFGVEEQALGHALPLTERHAALVELPANRPEVGQVGAALPHTARAA